MEEKNIYLIAAADLKNGIGKGNKLPWHLKKEMRFFRDTTLKTHDAELRNAVIMGRSTWESLKPQYRPLVGRKNFVLSTNSDYQLLGGVENLPIAKMDAKTCFSLDQAIAEAKDDLSIESIFIIGGESVYRQALAISDALYLTRIKKEFACDAFFPDFEAHFTKPPVSLGTEGEEGIEFEFLRFER